MWVGVGVWVWLDGKGGGEHLLIGISQGARGRRGGGDFFSLNRHTASCRSCQGGCMRGYLEVQGEEGEADDVAAAEDGQDLRHFEHGGAEDDDDGERLCCDVLQEVAVLGWMDGT